MTKELDEAVAHIADLFKNYDEQDDATKARLVSFLGDFKEMYEGALLRERLAKRKEAAKRRETNAARKKVRDEMIPKWCEENLQPGMIIKVKAKNNPWREVESVRPGYEYGKTKFFIEGELRGQHMHYNRTTQSFKKGSYITNHSLKYVQGVVDGLDERGYPKVIPIMDLVERRQQLQLDAAK